MSSVWQKHQFGSSQLNSARGFSLAGPASVASVTLALDSAYTYNSAGDAAMWGFFSRESANLTEFAVYIPAFNGTWGSTDGVINVQIREGLNGTRIPGTTLTGSFTITLNGTPGWFTATGLSIGLTAGRFYVPVIGDADGGASNYATLQVGFGPAPTSSIGTVTPSIGAATSANGFSSAGTSVTPGLCFAARIGDAYIGGSCFDAVNTVTSGTYARGLNFGVDEDCVLIGARLLNDQHVLLDADHRIRLYSEPSSGAWGSALLDRLNTVTNRGSGTSPTSEIILFGDSDWIDLVGGNRYDFVFKPGSALTVPRRATIVGTPPALVKTAMLGGSRWVDDSAVGGTPAYNDAAAPLFGPLIVPKTAVAGGAAGGFIIGG